MRKIMCIWLAKFAGNVYTHMSYINLCTSKINIFLSLYFCIFIYIFLLPPPADPTFHVFGINTVRVSPCYYAATHVLLSLHFYTCAAESEDWGQSCQVAMLPLTFFYHCTSTHVLLNLRTGANIARVPCRHSPSFILSLLHMCC